MGRITMNDDAKSKEVSKTDKELDKSVVKNKSTFGLWLLALLSLFAIGLSATVYFQLQKLKSDAFELPASVEQVEAGLTGLKLALSGAQKENQQLKIELVTVQRQQADMSSRLDLLFQRQDGGNDDWALAEIEHLLIIATHRLLLEHDVPMALAAMQAADDRLRDNDDFRLFPVRQQLTADINALKAVDAVDITGLVLFLSDLVGRVTELPLQKGKIITASEQDTVSLQEQSGKWEQLRSAIWEELKRLADIKRLSEESLATLMPQHQYFLFQNLRLQLESARYAALRRDTDNLHVSLDIIRAWLIDYFDTSDNGVANILESVTQMATLELNPPLPDISSSLETLRAYVKRQEESANTPQDQASELEQ